MRLTKREIILLVVVLVLAISYLFINFIYLPLEDDIEKLEEEYSQLLDEESKVKVLVIQTEALRNELKEIEESTEGVYDGMIEIWDQPPMLVYVEDLLKGLCDRYTVNSYTPVDVHTLRSAEINLSILTNYTNLQKLLAKFEDGEHYCTIESIDITVEARDSNNSEWKPMDLSVNLTVRFYAKGQSADYPEEEYEFMDGKYEKKDIFR